MAQQTVVEWLITLYQQTNKIDMFDLEVAKQIEQDQRTEDYKLGYRQGAGDTLLTNMIIDKNK